MTLIRVFEVWDVIATSSPFAAACSHRCAWPNYGRPSVHTTIGTDLDSFTDVCHPPAACCISILDALVWLMEPTVVGQLIQHDDAPDATLTYGVGH
jgi:hypothetical protein